MNDACDVMEKRLREHYLPLLADDEVLNTIQWKQEVSGNTGTIFELDLGKFTQEEFVHVFEFVIRRVCNI